MTITNDNGLVGILRDTEKQARENPSVLPQLIDDYTNQLKSLSPMPEIDINKASQERKAYIKDEYDFASGIEESAKKMPPKDMQANLRAAKEIRDNASFEGDLTYLRALIAAVHYHRSRKAN